MNSVKLVLWTALAAWLCRRLMTFWHATRSINNLPGYRTLYSQFGLVAFLLPPIRWICLGTNHSFTNKHEAFQRVGWDAISSIFVSPEVTTTIELADADAIREVNSTRARFPKPLDQYEVLTFFGRNIVASEGEEWKKYRKISASAFSDRNNVLVWDETIKVVNDLFEGAWKGKTVISVENAVEEVTLPLALFVISIAGFGYAISWDDGALPKGHKMTFKNALHISARDIAYKFLAPEWAMTWTEKLRTVKMAFEELRQYMVELIEERSKMSDNIERHDIFSNLLEANRDDGQFSKLVDDELIGNIYIFLLAGHETSAHTLAFALALLSLYPEEQEAMFEHIKSVSPDGRPLTYEQMPQLTYSLAVLNETLRMCPPVVNIPKVAAEDTTLTVGNMNGEKLIIPVPKGTKVALNTPALHYNPRYWDDPMAFKPSRFLKEYNRNAFIPFSAGPRACLGRKFTETEVIAALTMIISRYRVSITEEPQFANESFEQRKARVLSTVNILTLTPKRIPLTFTLRGTCASQT
ncbi:cytochrome P450 [Panaeolus papilionaceus]|nr:cytochrome P450 [Panaeolus papilionaceus]